VAGDGGYADAGGQAGQGGEGEAFRPQNRCPADRISRLILNPETKTFTTMGFRILRPLFPLGDVYLSAGAASLELDPAVIDRLLNRHHCGDWGDLDSEDKLANDRDLKDGGRLLSRYDIEAGSFYVITEWDWSMTTLMLREEY
jgi:hypothetical protein